MWNDGMSGTIDAGALCRLTALQVLALSSNQLRGRMPECIAQLGLQWLWLSDNQLRELHLHWSASANLSNES
jgi:hypothetical protein